MGMHTRSRFRRNTIGIVFISFVLFVTLMSAFRVDADSVNSISYASDNPTQFASGSAVTLNFDVVTYDIFNYKRFHIEIYLIENGSYTLKANKVEIFDVDHGVGYSYRYTYDVGVLSDGEYICSLWSQVNQNPVYFNFTVGSSHTHSYTSSVTKAPTCTATGVRTYTCSCGDSYTETIAATGHTNVTVKGYAATCAATGLTDGVQCSVCKTWITPQTTIAKTTNHTWNAGTVTKAATCKETGVKTYTCTVCKTTKTETIAKTTTHTWNSGTVTKAATCTATGVRTYKCTVCGTTKTETIAATGHTPVTVKGTPATCAASGLSDGVKCSVCGTWITPQTTLAKGSDHAWNSGTVTKAATCTEDGVKTYKCTLCSATKTETIPKTGNHTWNSGTITTKPGCETTGIKTYKCTVCGTTKTETIAAAGHNWSSDIAVAATCTTEGRSAKTYCNVCGKVKDNGSVIPALGHSWDSSKVTKAATCAAEGVRTYTCGRCGATKTETIPKTTDHKWDSGKVTTAATCTTDGVKTTTCSVCGTTKTESIPATGHTFKSDVAKAATCTQPGKSAKTYCSVCGYVKDNGSEIPATGHKWDGGTVTKAATCAQTGVRTYKCTVCGETKTDTLPKNGDHKWDSGKVTTEATCTASGSRTYTCTVCKTTKTEGIPAKGHTAVKDAGKAADCTHEGLTEGSHCSVCGAVIIAQQTLPARGHQAETDPGRAATCTENGLTEGSHCKVCGEVITAQTTIPNLGGHKFDAATGICSVCGLLDPSKCQHKNGTVIKNAAEATCTSDGYTGDKCCKDCGEVLEAGAVIAAKGHVITETPAKEPTCTEPGTTGGKGCSVCGAVFSEARIIPATGHTAVRDVDTQPTCTENGHIGRSHCSVCGAEINSGTDISALGHAFGEDHVCTRCGLRDSKFCEHPAEPILKDVHEPTCTAGGYSGNQFCPDCGKLISFGKSLSPLGHDTVSTEAVEPTCTEPGRTAGSYCSRCGEVFEEAKELPATGHDMILGVYCKKCGHVEVPVIPLAVAGGVLVVIIGLIVVVKRR